MEIQITFTTAAINNTKLIASDNRQELPYAKLYEYEHALKNDTINPYPFFDIKYPLTQKQKKLSELSRAQYYI